jgi:uncharacterized protein YciI
MVPWEDYKSHAKERGALALELFVVRSTPTGDPEAVKSSLSDHLAYQRELENVGQLVMAGPVSDESGDYMMGAGMIIYRAGSIEEAAQIAESDPMHKTGARSFTVSKWLVNEGRISVSVGLSTGNSSLS